MEFRLRLLLVVSAVGFALSSTLILSSRAFAQNIITTTPSGTYLLQIQPDGGITSQPLTPESAPGIVSTPQAAGQAAGGTTANTAPGTPSGPTVYNPYTPDNVLPYYSNPFVAGAPAGYYTPPQSLNWGSPVSQPGSAPYQVAQNAPGTAAGQTPPAVVCNCSCPPKPGESASAETQQAGNAPQDQNPSNSQ